MQSISTVRKDENILLLIKIDTLAKSFCIVLMMIASSRCVRKYLRVLEKWHFWANILKHIIHERQFFVSKTKHLACHCLEGMITQIKTNKPCSNVIDDILHFWTFILDDMFIFLELNQISDTSILWDFFRKNISRYISTLNKKLCIWRGIKKSFSVFLLQFFYSILNGLIICEIGNVSFS